MSRQHQVERLQRKNSKVYICWRNTQKRSEIAYYARSQSGIRSKVVSKWSMHSTACLENGKLEGTERHADQRMHDYFMYSTQVHIK